MPNDDWTVDPLTGKSNSSVEYRLLVGAIEYLIVDSAHDLIAGKTGLVADLILDQLVHKYHLHPDGDVVQLVLAERENGSDASSH